MMYRIQRHTLFPPNSSDPNSSIHDCVNSKASLINSECDKIGHPGMFNSGRVCVCETPSRCNMDHKGYPYSVLRRVAKRRVYGYSEVIVGKGLAKQLNQMAKLTVHPYMRSEATNPIELYELNNLVNPLKGFTQRVQTIQYLQTLRTLWLAFRASLWRCRTNGLTANAESFSADTALLCGPYIPFRRNSPYNIQIGSVTKWRRSM